MSNHEVDADDSADWQQAADQESKYPTDGAHPDDPMHSASPAPADDPPLSPSTQALSEDDPSKKRRSEATSTLPRTTTVPVPSASRESKRTAKRGRQQRKNQEEKVDDATCGLHASPSSLPPPASTPPSVATLPQPLPLSNPYLPLQPVPAHPAPQPSPLHPPPSQAAASPAVSPPASNPAAAAQAAAPSASATPPRPPSRHPHVKTESRQRPSANLLKTVKAHRFSNHQLVVKLVIPTNGRRNTRLPPPTTDARWVSAISHLLSTTLHIAAPPLNQLVSRQYPTTMAYVHNLIAHLPPAPRTPALESYLSELSVAAGRHDTFHNPTTEAALAALLVQHPWEPSTLSVAPDWTRILRRDECKTLLNQTKDGQWTLQLCLGFTSNLAQLAARHLLLQHSEALAENQTFTPASIHLVDGPHSHWLEQAIKDGTNRVQLTVKPYEYRYDTMRLSGFRQGPDQDNPPAHMADIYQVHGSSQLFHDFLSRAAPHCYHTPPTERLGEYTVQFVFQPQHACELYQLNGVTSPEHGITKPLKLRYWQHHKPKVSCCSLCGSTAHTAHKCDVAPLSASQPAGIHMDDEDNNNHQRRPVCRDCYDPTHESCSAPAEAQECGLCKLHGHTTFRCKLFHPTWIRVDPPATSRPRSQLPAVALAQQRGLPLPTGSSWSARVAHSLPAPAQRHPDPRPHPAPQALAHPPASGPFPPSPYSPAASTASPASSPPPSPPASPPPSPQAQAPSPLTAMLELLQSIVKQQADNIDKQAATIEKLTATIDTLTAQLRADHQHAEQRHRQAEQRFDHLLATLGPNHMTKPTPFPPMYEPHAVAFPSSSSSTQLMAPSPTADPTTHPATPLAPLAPLAGAPPTPATGGTSIHISQPSTATANPTSTANSTPTVNINSPPPHGSPHPEAAAPPYSSSAPPSASSSPPNTAAGHQMQL